MKYTICVPCYMVYHVEGKNGEEALEKFHYKNIGVFNNGELDIEDHIDQAFLTGEVLDEEVA